MGTSSSSLARSSRRKGSNSSGSSSADSSSRNRGRTRGSRASAGADGSSRGASLSPARDTHINSGRGVDGSGSGRGKLSLFKKTPPKHRGDNLPALPGGASVAGRATATVSPTPPTGSGSSRSSEASSEALSRADSRNSVGALSSSCVMPARTSSRDRPRTADGGCSRSGRLSIRISRQPSTYGELKVLVETSKLGGGVIRGLVGLQNLGNTCFMNSALQCLVNCEALADYFLGFNWKGEINKGNFLGHGGLMASAFGALTTEIWTSEKASIRPGDFKQQVGESMPLFAGYEQQDVQEFLAFLLDAVHEDLNRVPNADRKYVEAKEAKEGEPEEMVAMQAWKGYLERNRSIIVDLFQGQLRSALQCGVCGRRSVTFDPFMYLTVPLPDDDGSNVYGAGDEGGLLGGGPGRRRGRPGEEGGGGGGGGVSLESCIRRFCEKETLEGDNAWYCSNCKKHQPATKKLDLWKVPPVLIVHLKRFAGSAKISSPVEFPLEGLDLSEVVKSPQKEPPDYDLIATANHHGSVHGGHYTAAAKNRLSGNWNLFNDERVEGLEPHEVQTASAYVLFYAKMSTVEETVEEGEEGADNADDDGEHAGDVPEAEQPGTSRGRSPARKPAAAKSTAAAAGAAAGAVTAAGGVGAVSASSNSSSGGAGGGAGSGGGRFGFARGRRKTAGDAAVDARPASPKRAVAVVRRQSVSKPHNWPHVEDFQPSFQPAFQPAGSAELPPSTQATETEMEVCPDDAAVSSGPSTTAGKPGAVAGPVSRMLTRSAAEQGYGKLADGKNGSSTTKLPKLPGASSSLSPGGGSDDAAAPPGGSASGRKKHGSLRGGGGGAERFPS